MADADLLEHTTNRNKLAAVIFIRRKQVRFEVMLHVVVYKCECVYSTEWKITVPERNTYFSLI